MCVNGEIIRPLIHLGEIALNELVVAAEQQIGERIVAELSVEIELWVLLRRHLKVQRTADIFGPEGKLMTSHDHAEVLGELQGSGVDVRQGTGAAESAELIAEDNLRKIARRGSDFQADVGRGGQPAGGAACDPVARPGEVERVDRATADAVGVSDG